MRKLLSKKVAEAAKPRDKPYQIADSAIPGFCLRVQPTGAKLWKLRYTKDDRTRTIRTLGRMPVWTFEMAKARAEAILRGEDPDKTPELKKPPRLTFGRFLTNHYQPYLEQNHSRPKESLAYLKAFDLEEAALEDVRLAVVEAWRLKGQTKGRAPSTLNRQCSALKAALQRAVDWDLLSENPLRRLKPLKMDKRPVVRYLTHAENERLQIALAARDAALRVKRVRGNEWRKQRGYDLLPELGKYADNLTPIILIALNTGLRRSELWNLTWGDIDLKSNMLTVHGKGAKSKQTRHIPLNLIAQSAFRTYLGDSSPLSTAPVFGRHEFRKAFAGILKAAKIERFRFHDLRHYSAFPIIPSHFSTGRGLL